jgi:hypothetical protein
MSVRDLLARRAAAWSPTVSFTPVGAPALVVANESIPQGFYDGLRRTARPDGYILGPGCGNVLAMVEGFAAVPRGIVLVDVDPAVVCAGRMLVACLARQERLEDFVREFFCGGEATLASLEQEVLQAAESPTLRRRMEAQHARLWEGLAVVTEGFRYRPDEAGEWLRRWRDWDPTASGAPAASLPVRTLVANEHGLFQSLARRDDIAVLEASLFDPDLLAAVAELPGFAQSRNLVYLSNAADHVLRRAVLATAKAKLRLGPPPAASATALPRSPDEFLAFVNEQHLARLHAVEGSDERRTWFVYSTTRNVLTLRSTSGVPCYRAEDLELSADLEAAVLGFFGGAASAPGDGAARSAADGVWRQAAPLRRSASSLYAASVTGDPERMTAALEELAQDRTWRELPAAVRTVDAGEAGAAAESAAMGYLAFWTAELAYAALAVDGLAASAIGAKTLEKIGWAAARVRDAGPPPTPSPGLSPAAYLLALTRAQALALSGRLLRQEALEAAGLEALGRLAGRGPEREAEAWSGWEAEALLRLVSIHAHLPLRDWGGEMAELTRRLRGAVAPSGEVEPAPLAKRAGTEAAEPYLAFATRPGVIVESARWALLLHGLLSEEMEPILTALRMTYRARHGAATEETHVLFDRMLAAAGGADAAAPTAGGREGDG